MENEQSNIESERRNAHIGYRSFDSLLYILRNDLGLQGPRFGCGLGQCGTCTVIINGVAIRSFITPTSTVKSEITTLEGLAKNGVLHPLQQAWIDEQVPQCGFCQNGQS